MQALSLGALAAQYAALDEPLTALAQAASSPA